MELIGIKDGNFTDKNTGVVVDFLHLHVADEDKNVVGRAVDILKVKSERRDYIKSLGLEPGDEIKVMYDKFGKVDDVLKV